MLQNDRNPQDNFDPFGQEPSTPPTQEPFAQEDYTTEQGPDDEHKGEGKQNPLYGPDFFTQRGEMFRAVHSFSFQSVLYALRQVTV